VSFNTAEDGLKAMRLMWEISGEQGKTVAQRLSNWSVAGYTLPNVDMNKKFSDLSQAEQDDILIKQMSHEAPGMLKELKSAGIVGDGGIKQTS
jgi:hypothetical protein